MCGFSQKDMHRGNKRRQTKAKPLLFLRGVEILSGQKELKRSRFEHGLWHAAGYHAVTTNNYLILFWVIFKYHTYIFTLRLWCTAEIKSM